MIEQVLTILTQARWRTRKARSLEAGATCAAVGGLCGAAVQMGWRTSDVSLPAAVLLTCLPLIAAAAILLPAARRRLRPPPLSWFAPALSTAIGAFGLTGLALGWPRNTPLAAVPLAILAASFVAGAVAAFLRPPPTEEVAAWLDSRCQLGERMITAAELAGSPDRELPFSRAVFRQAAETARSRNVGKLAMWERTVATPAAAGLVLLLCLVLAILTPAPADAAGSVSQIAASAPQMTAAERARLAMALRVAAARAGEPELVRNLREAAAAADTDETRLLQEKLARLEAALRKMGRDVPAPLAAALADASAGKEPPGGETATFASGQRQTEPDATPQTRPAAGEGPFIPAVYDPEVAKAMRLWPPPASSGGPSPQAAQGLVDLDAAWSAARARAASAAENPELPPQYRATIRKFFLAD